MTDVTRLNSVIDALRPTKGAARQRGQVFTLSLLKGAAMLQGPRGNVVAEFTGTEAECRRVAEAHVARFPGAILNVY